MLEFNFPYDTKRVFDWWTELEPAGYVGLRLKRIQVVDRTPRGAKVTTYWSFMGFSFRLDEELEIKSETEWVWRSRFLGVPAEETFSLTKRDGGCRLRITSVMRPQSLLRKIMFLLIGWYWRAEDRREWRSAAKACVEELAKH